MLIELRSDTFTKPSDEMVNYMFSAPIGDDVFGEDPSVNQLERYAADLFGMEAALFCVSGTMTNQIAIKCHTQPGEEIICDETSHVYQYEGGGIAFNSGCQVRPIIGDRGRIQANQILEKINPDDIHKAKTSLVVLENTSNRGGGSMYDLTEIQLIKDTCIKFNIKLHLDGARLFNAMISNETNPSQYAGLFDSISICLSKGLGSPMGSLLLGTSTFISKARRLRKVFGGGTRQAGYMAAAGLFALQNNIQKLQFDHQHAKWVAEALSIKSFVGHILPVDTNIIIFELSSRYTAPEFCSLLESYNVKCLPVSATAVRMVFHLDVTTEMVQHLIKIIHELE